MLSQDEAKRKAGRKLIKRKKETRQVTMDIPQRFEDGDDADEDCTAPKGQNMMINQSVFGMIAAAGSQVDFHSRFEGQDSDDEDEDTTGPADIVKPAEEPYSESSAGKGSADEHSSRLKFHRRKLSDNKLLRSLSHLGPKNRSKNALLPMVLSDSAMQDKKQYTEMDGASRGDFKGPPVMSQMLEAKAEAVQRKSFDSRRSGDRLDQSDSSDAGGTTSSLAKRLMEIFHFEKPEIVIDGKLHILTSQGQPTDAL